MWSPSEGTNRRFLTVVLLALAASSLGCEIPGRALRPAREPERIIIFSDRSRSISAPERRAWNAQIMGYATTCGEELWDEERSDEILIYPVHARTLTASALAWMTCPGGEFQDNERRRARAEFSRQLDAIEEIAFGVGVLRHTDLLSTVDRVLEASQEKDRVTRVVYLSDMFESVPGRDFEVAGTVTQQNAERLAKEVIASKHWGARPLDGVSVEVFLPSTVSGVAFPNGQVQAVEAFWRALFEQLGADLARYVRG